MSDFVPPHLDYLNAMLGYVRRGGDAKANGDMAHLLEEVIHDGWKWEHKKQRWIRRETKSDSPDRQL
jgi:hypothetical protein